jgi:hypothetical protein
VKPRRVLGALAILVAAGLVPLNACRGALRVDPLRKGAGAPLVDGDLALARTYAPLVYLEIHASGGRQDLPAPVDFDGDLDGGNNWENLARFELVPTLYYAVLESGTHWFLTYHIFHPRDWEPFDLGVHMTHEGDGENLQVVVEKASGAVVLLFTQAHYCGGVYVPARSEFGDGSEEIRGELLLVDDGGRPSDSGKHAAVFVESKGHGIYGARDARARVEVDAGGAVRFEAQGLVLRPARPDEPVSEPPLTATLPIAYQLESTTAKLWPLLARGELTGEDRLLDGCVPYRDARVSIDLPRYHEGDRFSGPLGPDRGISPFAVDFGWKTGELGGLFFDPARRYRECLRVPASWSLEYERFPFDKDPG